MVIPRMFGEDVRECSFDRFAPFFKHSGPFRADCSLVVWSSSTLVPFERFAVVSANLELSAPEM